jgi:hypothetical protein
MITLIKLPVPDQQVLRVQKWLGSDDGNLFRALLHAEIAAFQEEAGRLLILAKDDDRKVADAKDAGAKASDLMGFIELMNAVELGEHEFTRAEVSISERILWKS